MKFKITYGDFLKLCDKAAEGVNGDTIHYIDGGIAIITSESGRSGGNCYGDEAQSFDRDLDYEDNFLSSLMLSIDPDISFLRYQKIESEIGRQDYYNTESEYYGNYTKQYGYQYIYSDVYNVLRENDVILPAREAVIVGGLPCSGKTTLAKTKYSGYFLIDDPKNLDKDIRRHFKKNQIVIADPHLSFFENRMTLRKLLEKNDYFVTEEILKVNKRTLLSRAKQLGKIDRLSFIKNFKVT